MTAAGVVLAGCGYKVAGKADLVPKNIQTIAIPPFANITTRYKLTDKLPAAIQREFLARTRYQMVTDPANADAVLTGSVVNVFAYPTTFDPVTGRAAAVQMHVIMQITLRDKATGKAIYQQPALEFRQRYEISTDPSAYFDESTLAFERLSQDVARSVVTAVLEMF
ncbi:MAG: hypothetical protein K2Q23_05360 [Bryobacteraceae bacterium]|nr:hypothetical protein [Bryobacteraceae bacterium]